MAEATDLEVELDPEVFARALREIKAVQPKLSTGIRREIRAAGKLVIGDVQAEIRSYPSRGRSTGMREKLASGLAVRIGTSAGGTKQGVFIVSTGRQLPASKKALVKAMNRATFRHPVFAGGRRASWRTNPGRQNRQWVDQPGMRYFRQSILNARSSQLTAAMTAAVQAATEGLR